MLRHAHALRLLIVDRDPAHLDGYRLLFTEPGVDLQVARSAAEALEQARASRPDVVILEASPQDMSGLEAFRRIRAIAGAIPVIFIDEDSTPDHAIEAFKCGAFDYLVQPLSAAQVRRVVANAVQVSRLPRFPAPLPGEAEAEDEDTIVGRSPAMQEIYKGIGLVAFQDFPVLITGESGTGKELVAHAIHQHSKRAERPFLAINCAAIPETLLESELFGHEKGAFTGADRQRIGKFEQADGGTLLLDEVGDMTPMTQAKVLRVLQDQRFERVGGTETLRTNVRVLAATNRDLEAMVRAGEFRMDLYYRLSVCGICLPPLRDRGADLPLLVEHFLRRFSREIGKWVARASPEAHALLERHSWPGNLRELQSVLKQALLRAHGPVLLAEFLPPYLTGEHKVTAPPKPGLEEVIQRQLRAGSTALYAEAQAEMDRVLLDCVMRHTQGNQARAARLLGITRARLRNKLQVLRLPTTRSEWSMLDQFLAGG